MSVAILVSSYKCNFLPILFNGSTTEYLKLITNQQMEQNSFERLISYLLVKNSPTFYRTWRFIAIITSAYNLSVYWARSIWSIPPHPTAWRSILILSTHLCLGLPRGLFPPPKPCMHLSSPLYMLKPHPSYSSRFDHPNSIWWAQIQIVLSTPLLPSPS